VRFQRSLPACQVASPVLPGQEEPEIFFAESGSETESGSVRRNIASVVLKATQIFASSGM
jgi:hypothetical protein